MFSPLVFAHMLTVTADIKSAAKPTDTMMHLNNDGKSESSGFVSDFCFMEKKQRFHIL